MLSTKILIAYVHDRPGVLTKIASIFYRRGMNIRTLTVGGTSSHEISKIVFRVAGEDEELRRLMLSVDNLVDVVTVDVKDDGPQNARELCLARLASGRNHSDEALRKAVERYDVRVWQHDGDSVVLEMVDAPERIDAFIATLQEFDLLDLSRTGATAIPGTQTVQGTVGYDDNVTSLVAHLHRH